MNAFQNTLTLEANAISEASKKVEQEQVEKLVQFFDVLNTTGGQLFFSGVGKSGYIAQKLCSTFSSLGLRSHFLHPIEALHGDLGRLNSNDGIVFISKSGTTEEILKLLPFLKQEKEMILSLVGDVDSPIAKASGISFDCSVKREACLNNLAPTTSSTLALAVGDAMAVVFEKYSGLTKEGFAVNHPAGLLGKTLSLKVNSIMTAFKDCPIANEKTTIKELLVLMTEKPTGACAFINDKKELLGLMVEGDIRRILSRKENVLELDAFQFANTGPSIIDGGELAIKALTLMEDRERPIGHLPVIENNKFVGILRVHDLLRLGFKKK